MTRTTLPVRILLALARTGLWLLLLGLPLLCYLGPVLEMVVENSGLFNQYSDIYIAGQPLEQAPPQVQWEMLGRLPAVLLLVAIKAGPALLIGAASSSVGLVLSNWLLRRRWPAWKLRRPTTLAGQAARWLELLVLAFGLGSLVHLLVPTSWFNVPHVLAVPELRAEVLCEKYLWPFAQPSAAASRGWTIYNPLVLEALRFQALKGSAIKLGALLATLLFHWRLLRLRTQPVVSA